MSSSSSSTSTTTTTTSHWTNPLRLTSYRYWLTRVILLRALAFLHVVAFSIAFWQNEYLIGESGLTPSLSFLNRLEHQIIRSNSPVQKSIRSAEELWQLMSSHPTLFWMVSPTATALNGVALVGFCLALFVLYSGKSNAIIQFSVWALYMSIVNVGQTWYSFGWETQLLETTFLSLFLVPIFRIEKYPAHNPSSPTVIWGYRWLLFRIMIGAGWIKLRGDRCWRMPELSCMAYHYQTQPVPNPLSPLLHASPIIFHRFEVIVNHLVELLLPWMIFMPRIYRIWGAVAQIAFQLILISSGNLSFLNWLTIFPALACFDDQSLQFLFSERELRLAIEAENSYNHLIGKATYQFEDVISGKYDNYEERHCVSIDPDGEFISMEDVNQLRLHKFGSKHQNEQRKHQHQHCTANIIDATESMTSAKPWSWSRLYIHLRLALDWLLFALIAYLSIPVVNNIMSPNQAMNTSFGAFKLVNTYGAFGSITRTRHEVIIQGTLDTRLIKDSIWYDYEFNCKPGDINRRPCVISPYHYRIDWLMWFAAFQSYDQCPWLIALIDRLLTGKATARALLAYDGDPFHRMERDHWMHEQQSNTCEDGEQTGQCQQRIQILPTYIRATLYEYEYQYDQSKVPSDNWAGKGSASATNKDWEYGRWWRRRAVREYVPPVEAGNNSVQQFLRQQGLLVQQQS